MVNVEIDLPRIVQRDIFKHGFTNKVSVINGQHLRGAVHQRRLSHNPTGYSGVRLRVELLQWGTSIIEPLQCVVWWAQA